MDFRRLLIPILFLLAYACLAGCTERLVTIDGIEVEGSQEFREETEKAITLLSQTHYYGEIKTYVKRIREHPSSGMDVYADKPTFNVARKSWSHSTIWYAGIIAHDSYHSKLYHEAKDDNDGLEPPKKAWTGSEAEKKCIDYQIKVLR